MLLYTGFYVTYLLPHKILSQNYHHKIVSIFKDLILIFLLCLCVGLCKCTDANRVQERSLDGVELEFLAVVNCLTWVQATVLRSLARTERDSSQNH